MYGDYGGSLVILNLREMVLSTEFPRQMFNCELGT